MFWFGLLLGMSAGIILTALITVIGETDRAYDAYQEGYDIGFYEAMSLKGDKNGKANKV